MDNRLTNPIFMQCIQYVGDPFWIDKLKRMAYNEPIRSCKYKKGRVYIGETQVDTEYPAKILWIKILDLFHEVGLYSPTERYYNDSVEECKNITTWTRVKSKNIKDKLLMRYCTSRGIDQETKEKLEKYLAGSTSVKIKKVHMEDGKIAKIDFREIDNDSQEKTKPDNSAPIITTLCVKYVKEETKVYQKYGLVH